MCCRFQHRQVPHTSPRLHGAQTTTCALSTHGTCGKCMQSCRWSHERGLAYASCGARFRPARTQPERAQARLQMWQFGPLHCVQAGQCHICVVEVLPLKIACVARPLHGWKVVCTASAVCVDAAIQSCGELLSEWGFWAHTEYLLKPLSHGPGAAPLVAAAVEQGVMQVSMSFNNPRSNP